MFYKNILAITLLTQALSIYSASPIQKNKEAQALHIIVTKSPAEQKQETPIARTYVSPSVETLQADKEFCLKTLSDDAADINALSPSGKTTLQLLTLYFINNFTTEQLIAHALKRGAETNIRDELERTPLFFVTAYAVCPEVFAEKQAALDDSVYQEKKIETKTVEITTEKDTSVEKNKEEAAEVTTPKTTRNPLHDRALSLAVVELLLAFNADPTLTDKNGISPLLLAVSKGDQEMVELFVRYGMFERIFQAEDMVETTNADQRKTTSIEESTDEIS